MKDILIEIKNNLQGDNNTVNEPKNQINDLEHKGAKNHHTEQQEEKRIQKKRRVYAASRTTSRGPTFLS